MTTREWLARTLYVSVYRAMRMAEEAHGAGEADEILGALSGIDRDLEEALAIYRAMVALARQGRL